MVEVLLYYNNTTYSQKLTSCFCWERWNFEELVRRVHHSLDLFDSLTTYFSRERDLSNWRVGLCRHRCFALFLVMCLSEEPGKQQTAQFNHLTVKFSHWWVWFSANEACLWLHSSILCLRVQVCIKNAGRGHSLSSRDLYVSTTRPSQTNPTVMLFITHTFTPSSTFLEGLERRGESTVNSNYLTSTSLSHLLPQFKKKPDVFWSTISLE